MSFQTLASLTAISKPAQQVVAEAKSQASDFDGIQNVVNDAIADLEDKVSALMDLAKESGAVKLDTVKDKDGMTVFKKIDKLTKEYTAAMKKLMGEAEMMVMQVAEGQVDQGDVLLEAKDYSDSAEFTEEFYTMISKVNDIKRVVKAPRFMNWMKVTDHNFDTNCEQLGRAVVEATDALHQAVNDLEDNLDSAA